MVDQTYTTTTKGGRGATDGVVSELSAFLTIKPGETDEVRAALGRFHARARQAPWDKLVQIGIVDMKHVIFDNGTRVAWNTAFETDFDPYLDDAVAILGASTFQDWLQHTVEWDMTLTDPAAIKPFLQSLQVPAVGFFRAIPDVMMSQVKKGQRLQAALDRVLDDPAGVEALQHPALKPLLEEAAD